MGFNGNSRRYAYPDPTSRSVTDPLSLSRIYRGVRHRERYTSRELPEEIPDSEDEPDDFSDTAEELIREIPDSEEEPEEFSGAEDNSTKQELNGEKLTEEELTEEELTDYEDGLGSYQSQETVIIPGGTKLPSKPQQRWRLHQRGVNCNGRLANEAPQYAGTEDMEEEPTQPSTQPFLDPRRLGQNASMSISDESDVICILHPCSPAAYKAVELVTSSTPQHILQNVGLSYILGEEILEEMPESPTRPYEYQEGAAAGSVRADTGGNSDRDTQDHMLVDNLTTRRQSTTRDIALRLSSKVKDPCLGFAFGRNPQRCDLLLGDLHEHKHISNMHFRIFLNDEGVIMLEDTSTNGTVVENIILKRELDTELDSKNVDVAADTNEVDAINVAPEMNPTTNAPKANAVSEVPSTRMMMLQQGSIIQLLTKNPAHEIKFIIGIPTRDHAGDRYQRNLNEYIAYVQQAKRQAAAHAQAKLDTETVTAPKQPIHPLTNGPLTGHDMPIKNIMTSNVTAASERYRFGMHWNGGEVYNVVGVVGSGAFAVVYQLATKSEGKVYAVKELEKRRFMKNGILDHKVDNELKIMKDLCHPHIVKYVDYHDVPNYLYIVMEYVPRGDLSRYMSNNEYMIEYSCQVVARQMCHALNYLHNCGITHRDIKPDNILIASVEPFIIKLSDFGLSKVVKDKETFLKTFCGTLLYCAPEVYPDYERCKQKLPRKRRRGNEPTPNSSPYNQAVDIWSLAAVLYHLSCGKPPFVGSIEDKGVMMLECIMEGTLSFELLTNNGVTDDGVDFLSAMLRIEPNERPTAQKCLEHCWISQQGDAIPIDPNVIAPGLEDIEEEEELDASQLSLAENHEVGDIDDNDDGGSENDIEVEEFLNARQSKRFKFNTNIVDHIQQELPSNGEVTYPYLPNVGVELSSAMVSRPVQENRLFGEIGASALRSSGVLGHDAQVALDMPMNEIHGFEGSIDHYTNASEASQLGSADLLQPHYQYPQTLRVPQQSGLALSLFGAEAQIAELNMASPESGVSAPSAPTAPTTPKTPKSRQFSPSTSSYPGSKRSSQDVQSSNDGNTPKRSRFDDRSFDRSISPSNPMFYYDELDPTTHNLEYASKASGRDFVAEFKSRQGVFASTRANSITDDKTFEDNHSKDVEVGYKDNVMTPETRSQHSRSSDNRTSHAASTAVIAKTNKFTKPLPRLGKLTSLPGSVMNITFPLEQRITSWGREPSTNTFASPNPYDTRISKNAIDILFWRAGIERAIQNGIDWLQIKDVCAIITTRSNTYISINGVRLSKGQNDGWYYGKLMTGDIISVFERGTEYLKFKCEFYHGISKEVRPAGETFIIEKETEKFQQAMSRRSSAVAEEIAVGGKAAGSSMKAALAAITNTSK